MYFVRCTLAFMLDTFILVARARFPCILYLPLVWPLSETRLVVTKVSIATHRETESFNAAPNTQILYEHKYAFVIRFEVK